MHRPKSVRLHQDLNRHANLIGVGADSLRDHLANLVGDLTDRSTIEAIRRQIALTAYTLKLAEAAADRLEQEAELAAYERDDEERKAA